VVSSGDVNVVRSWLGRTRLDQQVFYAQANLDAKSAALERVDRAATALETGATVWSRGSSWSAFPVPSISAAPTNATVFGSVMSSARTADSGLKQHGDDRDNPKANEFADNGGGISAWIVCFLL
jgi:hypothetical protein